MCIQQSAWLYLRKCAFLPRCVWQLSGLAAPPCLSAHPYDIIWHWSSCLLSPPSLLPLPSFSPPLLCSRPGMDGGRDRVCQTLFCFSSLLRVPRRQNKRTSCSIVVLKCFCLFLYLPITLTSVSIFHLFLSLAQLPSPRSSFLQLSTSLPSFFALAPASISIYEWVLMGL